MNKVIKSILDGGRVAALPLLSAPAAKMLGVNVSDMVLDPDLQAKAVKALADRYSSAASVSMMDLSVEAEAFGAAVRFSDDEVPSVIGALVEDYDSAEALTVPPLESGRIMMCVKTTELAKRLITDRPYLAGVIGPYSLVGRLMSTEEALIACYTDPDTVTLLLEKATEFLIGYINAHKAAGADGVVMAEPLAGMLSPALAEEFSEPFVRKIVEMTQTDDFAVVYHNCGDNVSLMLDSIIRTGSAAYHFGNSSDMVYILNNVPAGTCVMGNVDPVGQFKQGTEQSIKVAAIDLMEKCSGFPGFVISSGCDVPVGAPLENIDAFYDAVNEFNNGGVAI